MLAVHFGSGNIGRGLVGWLLARSGYEVLFVDINPDLVRRIQERRRYTVRFLDAEGRVEEVSGVSALDGRDQEAVARAVAAAEIVTTAVGPRALEAIAPAVAAGIRLRARGTGSSRPLNVIACENLVGAGTALREAVGQFLESVPEWVGFPNAVVDRIVPNASNHAEDPLQVAVEPYYEWLVDAQGFAGDTPVVTGMQVVHNLEAYAERKLFGLNTGHAIVAYLGHLRGYETIDQAASDPLVRSTLLGALVESGLTLVRRHGFSEAEQAQYASRLLDRMANPALGDRLVRVGREPLRKLGPRDRLVGPARLAAREGIVPSCLARGIAAGYQFTAQEDPQALGLAARVRREGLKALMQEISGISPDSLVGTLIQEEYRRLTDPGLRRAG